MLFCCFVFFYYFCNVFNKGTIVFCMTKNENLHLVLLNVACKSHDADWNWRGVSSPFARMYMVESG